MMLITAGRTTSVKMVRCDVMLVPKTRWIDGVVGGFARLRGK
jgi:hypothetical protein